MKHPKYLLAAVRSEYLLLIVIVLVCGGLWAFIELADEVIEGDTHAMDEAILLAMRNPEDRNDPIGPGWIEEMGRDFTALGGLAVLSLIGLIAVGYLVLRHKGRTAFYLATTVGGGILVSTLLKSSFDRPRPDLVPHGSIVYTASFPSGHSMMAAVVYLTAGALLARSDSRPAVKLYLLVVAISLTALVGISRVYLGVHWPTDVLAGWMAGAIWALLCWLGARMLQRRGEIEPESSG